MELVWYSSSSGNTARFVERLGLRSCRIPISPKDPMPSPSGPYLLLCPTYAAGDGRGAVPKQVIHFLNDPTRRGLIRGVVGAGNRNFGQTYCLAARIIAGKCQVPLVHRFELSGMEADVDRVKCLLADPEIFAAPPLYSNDQSAREIRA